MKINIDVDLSSMKEELGEQVLEKLRIGSEDLEKKQIETMLEVWQRGSCPAEFSLPEGSCAGTECDECRRSAIKTILTGEAFN